MMRFGSPHEARAIAVAEFVAAYEPTCACRPLELRLEGRERLECARCARVVVRRAVTS
jgi:hypothetical protein